VASVTALIWTVVFLALAAAAYLGLGGRAIFGTRERPERILGRRAQLFELESGPKGLDPQQAKLPAAIVEGFTPGGEYVLRFEAPTEWLGKTETHAYVSARHVGYAVSLAASPWPWRPGVVVNGHFGSGEGFICGFRLL
jgi:hypothetical protein